MTRERNHEEINQRAQKLGLDLFNSFSSDDEGWLQSIEDQLLEWSMKEPAIKTPLFRFVDVLPALHSSREVVEHLRFYFEKGMEVDRIPTAMSWALKAAQARMMPTPLVARFIHYAVRRLARRFIAGEELDKTMSTFRELLNEGVALSVDRLGEEILSEPEADQYQRHYLDLLDRMKQLPVPDDLPHRPLSLSLKLTALDSQFDPMTPTASCGRIMEKLRPVLREARDQNMIVYFDMEHEETKRLTFRMARRVLTDDEFHNWDGLGVVIQAYLKRSEQDCEELIEWVRKEDARLWVRLVKGAYWDFERIHATQNQWPVPVFEKKGQTDQNYETLARMLAQSSPHLMPAFGSHNVRSLAYGIATARHFDLPAGKWECQMLYGMGEPIRRGLVDRDIPVRVYSPYGDLIPGMAYLVRRLLENTSNESFLRKTFHEDVDPEQLLRKPDPRLGEAPAIKINGYRTVGPSDFSKPTLRNRMFEALEEVREELGKEYPLYVGRDWIKSEKTRASINPSRSNQAVGEIHCADEEIVERAIETSEEVSEDWGNVPPGERADWLDRLGARMEEERYPLAALEIYECGKNWREADADVMEAVDYCHYYAREWRKIARGHRWSWPGEENDFLYEPRGPAAIISPWNFPLAILTGMTTAALVTGNPVLVKPSTQSPIIAYEFTRLAYETGLPEGVLQFIPGSGKVVGEMLVRDSRIAQIAFTGSREIGLKIERHASRVISDQTHLKQTVLEMGGKNAIIVDNDANLDEAVAGVARSAFGYQGQKCSACSRVIILEEVADQFRDRLTDAVRSFRLGPADQPENFMGPVIDQKAVEKIQEYQNIGRHEGRVVLEPDLPDDLPPGHYVGPMIIDEVDPGDVVACEEIFGPILSLIRVKDIEQAIEIANGVDYALTGGLYSRNPAVIERVKNEFKVGNLYINRSITGALVGRQPFGGYKMSGKGTKAGSPHYLRNFVWPRTVTENSVRRGFAPEEHL